MTGPSTSHGPPQRPRKSPQGRGSRDRAATQARLRALQQRTSTEAETVVLASARIRVPDTVWVGPFTRRHPDLRVEYLSFSELDADHSVSDLWISGPPAGAWSDEISRFPDILRVEALAEVGGGGLYRIAYRNPPVVYFYRQLGIPLPLPIWMQSGTAAWEVVARGAEFRRILDFGRSVDPNLRIISLRRGPLQSRIPALSPAQHRILDVAMSAGYFEVPRKIGLTDLARRIGRSRSAVSSAIAVIEEKLLDSAFSGTAFRGPRRSYAGARA